MSMEWVEDEELRRMLEGLKLRDAVAFAQFCDWFESYLWGRIRAELSQLDLGWVDADDIGQEVLMRFWEICPRLVFEGVPAIRRYLAKMARSTVLDRLRHARASCRDVQRTVAEGSRLSRVCFDRGHDPLASTVLREFMQRASGILTARQREICALRCADHSWSTIAARLGVSVNSAQKQLQRAYDRVSDEVHRDDSAYRPRCRVSKRRE